jgi:signal transduction histidine kinase
MHSFILIGEERSFLKSFLEEVLEGSCRIVCCNHLADLFPGVLTEEPVAALIDGRSVPDSELGVIGVLKNTFPHIRVLFCFPENARDLAAKTIASGADAYIMEPYYPEELRRFIRNARDDAEREMGHTLEMRMKALARFIEGLAPEINNRLTPILGTLQILMAKDRAEMDSEEMRESFRVMYEESLRIARTVSELENFAKPRRPKKNTVSLASTVKKAIQTAEEESGNAVPIENRYEATLTKVLIDGKQITTALAAVILFLKENADEDKGKVILVTETPSESTIRFTVEGQETVKLGEEVVNAFIPLYLRNIVRFGLEIGLASAYGLVQSHNGTIGIETLAQGTRFVLTIPLEKIEP